MQGCVRVCVHGKHKLVSLYTHVRVCVCACMSVCGSPRGLPQAYHTQAVRDELPESEGEGKKGVGGIEAGREGRAGGGEGRRGEGGGVVCAAVSALFV